MNCRPHNSRLRIDLTALDRFEDVASLDVLRAMLGEDQQAKLTSRVPLPPPGVRQRFGPREIVSADESGNEPGEIARYRALSVIVNKLRLITSEANVYQQDTGAHVLSLGFPLLSLPPGLLGREVTRRVLAPIAFLPIELTLTRGANASLKLECYGEGVDRVVPNVALFTWLSRLSGQEDLIRLFEDEAGERPLREIVTLATAACRALNMAVPEFIPAGHAEKAGEEAPDLVLPETFKLLPTPNTDELGGDARLLPSAVMGLFPMANQGLIQDVKAMVEGEKLDGPAAGFVKVGVSLGGPPPLPPVRSDDPSLPVGPTSVKLVADADPCQREVVRLARSARGVVVHGPPGTGKSQTILNIIGDHLSRGLRVLFVSDKRTALDVVLNRLDSVGLSGLAAVVHDPQKDQRDFYRRVRDQLDGLIEEKTDARAEQQLAAIEAEINELHAGLSRFHRSLMQSPDAAGRSFSDLVGRWLALPDDADAKLSGLSIASSALEKHASSLGELFDRADASGYASNAWAGVASADVQTVLARPVDEMRAAVSKLSEAAASLDMTIVEGMPKLPVASRDVTIDARRLSDAGELLGRLQSMSDVMRRRAVSLGEAELLRWSQDAVRVRSLWSSAIAQPLDQQLVPVMRGLNLSGVLIEEQIKALESFQSEGGGLLGMIGMGRRGAASAVTKPFGLGTSPADVARLRAFLEAWRLRIELTQVRGAFLGANAAPAMSDEQLLVDVESMVASVEVLSVGMLVDERDRFGNALVDSLKAKELAVLLAKMPARAEAVKRWEAGLRESKLFSGSGLSRLDVRVRSGEPMRAVAEGWLSALPTYESVVRIEKALAELPPEVGQAIGGLLAGGSGAQGAREALEKRALSGQIAARLAADPRLTEYDGQKIQSAMKRLGDLERDRQLLVQRQTVSLWVGRARSRLINATGNRLNPLGADLKRRFTMTGKNAMRLRKVIALGNAIPDGDPLFDLRPVWMASPETVAQLFPRKAMFDVVIFDEASQCRLEESLPVLLRARRMVIAGDEKQLPPTRFFESDIESVDSIEADDSQGLFELQQSQTEDLLGAALQLEVQEAYLDVHYRSRHAALIGYSNTQFYRDRLQAIPGHPLKRVPSAPIRLVRVDGTYEKSVNIAEADAIVKIVRELLESKSPPSIGIAAMNVQQRDAIASALDAFAEEDEAFARRLDAARSRTGKGGFEGLFVKNLENVQGDERDHMIISTTYGPDKAGRFYKRFGPLQQQGGGRRLNVLVTRAKEAVHVVTSVPTGEYSTLPPIPEGTSAGGGWLLFAYLKYADEVTRAFAEGARIESGSIGAEPVRSVLVDAIADRLKRSDASVLSYFGNEGFRVDLALGTLADPTPGGRGVLVDGSRFTGSIDPVSWDIFRQSVLERAGWKLDRHWSPLMFRDPKGAMNALRDPQA